LRVGGTLDDKRVAGAYSAQHDAVINRQVKRGYPKAQEIELYGLAEKNAPQVEDSRNGAEKPKEVEKKKEAPTEKPEDIGEETPEF
jgi:hypothetical protein